MQKKKLLTTLIITMLTFSMTLAFMRMASAINAPTLTPPQGPVGTKVKVEGDGATAGLNVTVYWDAVLSWDGVKGYLNWTTAIGDGSYELYVTIPEATNGTHYIIAFDVTSSTSAGSPFDVTPEITLTPKAGLPEDSVNVTGTGFAGTSDVDVYFTNSTTEALTITVTGSPGTTVDCNGTLSYKSVPLSVNITLQTNQTGSLTYDLMVYDNGTGGLSGNIGVSVNASGTINYETKAFVINITSTSDLEVDSSATATYLRSLTPAYPADTATTSSVGSFDASFTVPDVIRENYTVLAIDESLNSANATFRVGPSITLTPDEGPTGAVIDVAGRGFTPNGVIASVTIDTTDAPLIENNTIDTDGAFSGKLVIPTVPIGAYNITVEDNATSPLTAMLPFTVTGTTKITVSPGSGIPGNTISITGENFTAKADTEVTVTFNTTPPTPVGTFKTTSTGEFSGTFNVPAVPDATYTVNATDANGLTANTTFVVGLVYAALSKTEGPTGSNVTATGRGFTVGTTVNGTLDDKLLFSGVSVQSDGSFAKSFIVPTVPVGTYTVTIMDTEGVKFELSFKVTDTTELILTPSIAPAGYNVTVEANYFTATSGIAITFIIKNATWSYDFTGNFTPTPQTNATGRFKGSFMVNETWAIGSYTINATDATTPNGLTAEAPFTIASVFIDAKTRAPEYLQGDTFSFYIKCDLDPALTIEIKDSNNYPYGSISIATTDWMTFDGFQVIPYNKTLFTLPSDAELGAWNWTITSAGETLKTSTFTVVARPTLTTILDELADLEATLVSLDGTVATIDSNVGEIKVSVAEINLKVVAINGTVATIETDLGTMQGTVTSIDDNVATIQTDVGTVKADVSDIVETGVTIDLTPVWIAVAFSILAFLAAIAAAYMLRSKLA